MARRAFLAFVIVTAAAMSLRGASTESEPGLTPGAVVLLANNQEPAAAETLRRALVDPDRDVRRAAARVAAVAHREVYGPLMEALKTEHDEAAAVELTKAAMVLAGANGVAIVEPFAQRAGAAAHLEVIEWVARMDPSRFAARLPDWAKSAEPAATAELPELVALAALRHPTSRDAILHAWMTVAPDDEWGRVLRRLFSATDSGAARDALLRDALASDRPSVRGETIWFVLRIVSLDGRITPSLVEDASRAAADGDDWAAFGRELIARRTSKTAPVSREDLIRRDGKRHKSDLMAAWTSGRLTPAERSAVKVLHANVQISSREDREAPIATPDPLASFLLESTERAAGCRAGDAVGVARVAFAPDGKAAHIALEEAALPPTCESVLTAMARVSMAARQDAAYETQELIVPFSPVFASCAAALDPHERIVRNELGEPGIELPRLVKGVKPVYTLSAKDKRMEGIVELEARLTAGGCIASARVTRSLGELDLQAIRAALAWQFSPARKNGGPVPMIISIELTFRL